MKKTTFLLLFSLAFSFGINAQPDYKKIAPFFKKYVSEDGIIDYKALKKNELELSKTLKYLTDIPPRDEWHRNERLAYWLNVYNLQMISMLLENYPAKNILDLYGGKIWQVKCVEVGGKSYCLDEIEHDIIRAELKEPRIHFALYSGAMSSPALLNDVFSPMNMNDKFELLTKRFINSSNNKITANKVELSKIFEWYKEDFKNPLAFINKYSKTQIRPTAEISFLPFDWRLRDEKIKVASAVPTIPPVVH
jgi:hypothetical protein